MQTDYYIPSTDLKRSKYVASHKIRTVLAASPEGDQYLYGRVESHFLMTCTVQMFAAERTYG